MTMLFLFFFPPTIFGKKKKRGVHYIWCGHATEKTKAAMYSVQLFPISDFREKNTQNRVLK
jgi:hypothetical protein